MGGGEGCVYWEEVLQGAMTALEVERGRLHEGFPKSGRWMLDVGGARCIRIEKPGSVTGGVCIGPFLHPNIACWAAQSISYYYIIPISLDHVNVSHVLLYHVPFYVPCLSYALIHLYSQAFITVYLWRFNCFCYELICLHKHAYLICMGHAINPDSKAKKLPAILNT